MGGAGDRGVRHLLREGGAHRYRRREPHRLRRARRREHVRPALPDLGHDLAGLQPVRRQQPLRRRPRDRSEPRLQGQLQPAVHDPRHDARGLGVQRRIPDGPLARSQRLQRQLFIRRRQRSPRRARFSSTRHFSRSVTTSTGQAPQRANVEAARAPACTSRSSAATKCSGRRAGRTASRPAATPYRTLVTYKETHANAKIDPASRRLDRHLARSRASVRRPTAGGPRTR